MVGGSEASKRRPPTKKKVKLIKKKRLKKKPSTEGSDGGGESTTAEGGSEGENNGLHECWSGQIQIPIQIRTRFPDRKLFLIKWLDSYSNNNIHTLYFHHYHFHNYYCHHHHFYHYPYDHHYNGGDHDFKAILDDCIDINRVDYDADHDCDNNFHKVDYERHCYRDDNVLHGGQF